VFCTVFAFRQVEQKNAWMSGSSFLPGVGHQVLLHTPSISNAHSQEIMEKNLLTYMYYDFGKRQKETPVYESSTSLVDPLLFSWSPFHQLFRFEPQVDFLVCTLNRITAMAYIPGGKSIQNNSHGLHYNECTPSNMNAKVSTNSSWVRFGLQQ